jgi:hypothetical protein
MPHGSISFIQGLGHEQLQHRKGELPSQALSSAAVTTALQGKLIDPGRTFVMIGVALNYS